MESEGRTPRPDLPSLFFRCRAERRIFGRKAGLAELTLRLPYDFEDPARELRKAVSIANKAYAGLDGWGYDVVLTANAVLVGGTEVNPSYSLYFGQDFSDCRERSITEGGLVKVEEEADLDKVPTYFGLEEFSRHFERVFWDTSVRVHSLVNLVYLLRKPVGGDRVAAGPRTIHNILY